MRNITKINLMKVIILSIFALLIFILNVPGTIALRNILAASLLFILIIFWAQAKISIKTIMSNMNFRTNIVVLCSLTIYIFFHSIFIADEVSWSLSQYRTQWIYPMIYFMMGFSIATIAYLNLYFDIRTLLVVLFYSLFAHIIFVDIVVIYKFLESGNLMLNYGGLTKSPVLSSYVSNIIISIIIIEFIYRLKEKKKILQLNNSFLLASLSLCIFSSIIGGLRFGAISLFFMSLTALVLVVIDNDHFNNKAKASVSLAMLILCALPLLYNAKSDDRWLSLIETIPIAFDTENHTYWRDNEKIPKLSNGDEVSHSNYMRIAWAVKGFEYIKNDLFGIGYGRNVFGHAIQKYEKSSEEIRGRHSHSGIIDFTIGVGLIGLAIWLFFMGRIIIISALSYLNSGNYFSLMTLFISSGFFIRSIVDSNMRDHMFKQFFLILGIAMTLAAYENNKKFSDAK